MSKDPKQIDDIIQEIIINLLRLSILLVIFLEFTRGNWETFFISILALMLTTLPNYLERQYKIKLPVEYDFVIVLFIYASVFLGSAGNLYEKYWWWDTLLHTSSGVVLGFAGFLVLYTLYKRKKMQASPFLFAFFAFSFAMALGAVWEIFEFAADGLFGLNMQRGDLDDTMWDLIVDGVGGLYVSYLAYGFMKRQQRGWISRLVNNFVNNNHNIKSRKQL